MRSAKPPRQAICSQFPSAAFQDRDVFMKHYAESRAGIWFAFTLSLILLGTSASWAQQRQLIKFETPAANTKYTEQHSIAVGDVAGHDIRIFENLRTFPNAPLVIGEVRVKEWWTHGLTDFTETNGPGIAYHTLLMENGDKIFIRVSFVAQSVVSADGSRKGANNLIAGPITGGTGRFLGIRGMLRLAANFDLKSGSNETKGEIEYWMER